MSAAIPEDILGYKSLDKLSHDLNGRLSFGIIISNYIDPIEPLEALLRVVMPIENKSLSQAALVLHAWMMRPENQPFRTAFEVRASQAWIPEGVGEDVTVKTWIKKNTFKDPLVRPFAEVSDGPINRRPDGRELTLYFPKMGEEARSPEECQKMLLAIWKLFQDTPIQFGYCQSSDQIDLEPIQIRFPHEIELVRSPFQVLKASSDETHSPLMVIPYEHLLTHGIKPSEWQALTERRALYEKNRLVKFLERLRTLSPTSPIASASELISDFYPSKTWETLLTNWKSTHREAVEKTAKSKCIDRSLLDSNETIQTIKKEFPLRLTPEGYLVSVKDKTPFYLLFLGFCTSTSQALPGLFTQHYGTALQEPPRIISLAKANEEIKALSNLCNINPHPVLSALENWIGASPIHMIQYPARTQFLLYLFNLAVEAHQQYRELSQESHQILSATQAYVSNQVFAQTAYSLTQFFRTTVGRIPGIYTWLHAPIKADKAACFKEIYNALQILLLEQLENTVSFVPPYSQPAIPAAVLKDWYEEANKIITNTVRRHVGVTMYSRIIKSSRPASALIIEKILVATTPKQRQEETEAAAFSMAPDRGTK